MEKKMYFVTYDGATDCGETLKEAYENYKNNFYSDVSVEELDFFEATPIQVTMKLIPTPTKKER